MFANPGCMYATTQRQNYKEPVSIKSNLKVKKNGGITTQVDILPKTFIIMPLKSDCCNNTPQDVK